MAMNDQLPTDTGDWLEERLLACPYPRTETVLAWLARVGVTMLVNLHEQAHDPAPLARHGLRQVHLPVPDFTPPTPAQIEEGVATIIRTLAAGGGVAVHCGAGLGRTGTLLACYLVARGHDPSAAIEQVRESRPGSIEMPEQEAAVVAYAARLRPTT
jgi:atypical dual specificity phosphatase